MGKTPGVDAPVDGGGAPVPGVVMSGPLWFPI